MRAIGAVIVLVYVVGSKALKIEVVLDTFGPEPNWSALIKANIFLLKEYTKPSPIKLKTLLEPVPETS